jgi:hypothetical protein
MRVRNDTKRNLIAFDWAVQIHQEVAFFVKSVDAPQSESYNLVCDKGWT